jgi:hypothetical protein
MEDLPSTVVRKGSQGSTEDEEEDMLVRRLSSKCLMPETAEQGSAKSKHKSKKPDISETELKLLMDNFSMEELKRMLEDGFSAADFEQLKANLRRSRNTRDLKKLKDNDLISEGDCKKLKIDLERCEVDDMVRRECISTSDSQKVKDDLMQYENEQAARQAKDDPQAMEALPTMDQLKVSRDSGDISEADFKILKGNCDRYELKQKLDRDCISAADFEQLKGDLRRSENTQELKYLRDNVQISAKDFAKLTVDFERCELEALKESGRISESDLQKLKQDLTQSENTSEETQSGGSSGDLSSEITNNTSEDMPAADSAV